MAKMANNFKWNAAAGGGGNFDPTPLLQQINALNQKVTNLTNELNTTKQTLTATQQELTTLKADVALKGQANTFTAANIFNQPVQAGEPTAANHLSTKKYVDDAIANVGGQPQPPVPQPPNPLLEQRVQALEQWKLQADQHITTAEQHITELQAWKTATEPTLTDLTTNAAKINQKNIFTHPQQINVDFNEPALTLHALGQKPAYVAFAQDNNLLGFVGKESRAANYVTFSGVATAKAHLSNITKGVNAADVAIMENISDAQTNLNGASEQFVLDKITELKNGNNQWAGTNQFNALTKLAANAGQVQFFDGKTGDTLVETRAWTRRGVVEFWSSVNRGSIYFNNVVQAKRDEATLPDDTV